MEPLTWTGSLAVLTPILWTAAAAFVLLAAIRLIAAVSYTHLRAHETDS